MSPADRALAARIRRDLWAHELRVCVSGLDGAGKSTLCAALAEALGVLRMPFRDPAEVAGYIGAGYPPGVAQGAAAPWLARVPRAVLDRGPLCVAAIHPEMEGWGWLYALDRNLLTILLDLPLEAARARKVDPEAELRDREAEARRYRELAARWPRTAVVDASQSPGEVLSAALAAVARAVGVAT
jgi:hypothetical protein